MLTADPQSLANRVLDPSLRLLTARLVLRPVEERDAASTASLMTEEVAKHLVSWNSPVAATDILERIKLSRAAMTAGAGVDFAITFKGDLIGWLGAMRVSDSKIRLGYWLGSQYQSRGFAREAATAFIPVACALFRVGLIEAFVLSTNERSIRLLRSLGFTHDQADIESIGGGRLEMRFLQELEPDSSVIGSQTGKAIGSNRT